MTKFSPSLFWCHWNLQYGAVGNNKSILWSSQNSLVTFMFGVVERNVLAAFYTYFRSLKVWFAYKHQALGGIFKMAANWLQNRFITTMSCSIQSYFWDWWMKHSLSELYIDWNASWGLDLEANMGPAMTAKKLSLQSLCRQNGQQGKSLIWTS